jgi:uncharacterized damage-inducible protein DinB
MMLATQVQALAAYNRWMNDKLYAACAELSDEERKADRKAFFKSIHGTLNHILVGDRIWLGRFIGKPYSVGSLAEELYADFGELRAERRKMDAAIVEWAASVTDADFDRDLRYTSVVNPQPRSYPFWFAAAQFFNHQTHHRGQLTTLLSQRGIDPGVTDLIWLPEMQSPA